MKDACFAILHEGKITQIEGSESGDLWIEVQCDYLREKISPPGSSFRIKLKQPQFLSYAPAQGGEFFEYSEILACAPVILSTDIKNHRVLVFCETGVLNLEYTEAVVYLNTTTTISIEELEDVATEYWDEMDSTSLSLSL